MIDTRESLYSLLPAYVRQRDLQSGGALRELLAIIADQAILLERDLATMYDNWFIETCEDWVVPYLGDLLGYRASASSLGGTGNHGFSARREVANLLAYRRRKGSAALLDGMSRDIGGWPGKAVELYQHLITAQHLDHLNPDRLATIDLHDARALQSRGLPAESACHLGDVRRTSNAESTGLYNASGVAAFVFRMRGYAVSTTSAYCREDVGTHCYTFSILGNDAPLYRLSRTKPGPCGRAEPGDLALPIGRFELERDASPDATSAAVDATLYGEGRSLSISAPGWTKKEGDGADRTGDTVPADAIIPADLSDWAYKVPRNRIAIDPALGRIMFATGHAPRKAVKVSYAYGFAMDLGGGEYARPLPPMPAHVSRRRVRALDAESPREGEFASIAAAIADWQEQRTGEAAGAPAAAAPGGPRETALPALLVELVDSGVYRGYLDVSIGAGESLFIVAAPGTRPVLWLSDENAGVADAISIRGAAASRFALDGVLVAGRGINFAPAIQAAGRNDPGIGHADANENGEAPDAEGQNGNEDNGHQDIGNDGKRVAGGDLCQILIRHCTLVPGWGLSHDCEPRRPSEPSIVLDGTRACLHIDHSIVGAIRINSDGEDGPQAQVLIEDSIVDATSDARAAIAASADAMAMTRLRVARSTIVGQVLVHQIDSGDDSLFVGHIAVARRQSGCLRYSWVPPGSRTPRRHRCQPDGVIAAIPRPVPPAVADPAKRAILEADASLRTAPRFAAIRYGSPDYLRLTACTASEIARGAEDGAQMGVYHDLFEPQRTDALEARLSDYVPAGVDASVLIAS